MRFLITTIQGISLRKVVTVMSPPNQREYVPLNLRKAMHATRLANAHQSRLGISKYRYTVVCNVHEGIDTDREMRILDVFAATRNDQLEGEGPLMVEYIGVPELLDRLPLDLRKLVEYS